MSDGARKPEWAQLLVDAACRWSWIAIAGRETAARIANDLKAPGVPGSVIDLAPDRDDGYDLIDWLHDHHAWPPERIRAAYGNYARGNARLA
ncbi:MAG: hypothetical protein JO262_19195 [Solirubrobacterales bacterium]|nr:hypothetical protein [Solirubrobacterales bacterium]